MSKTHVYDSQYGVHVTLRTYTRVWSATALPLRGSALWRRMDATWPPRRSRYKLTLFESKL
jgi:hypothetical protein